MDEKLCTKCRTIKPIDEFAPNRNHAGGRHVHCRICSNAYRAEWGKRNPRPYSVRKKEYYEGDKLHIQARRHVNHQVACGRLLKASEHSCADCGERAAYYDHVAGYERQNWLVVQPVCAKCSGRRDVARKSRVKHG